MAIFTPPPAVPQRGDRSTFSSRVDAFLTWLAGLIPQLTAFLAQLTTLAAGGAYSLPYTVDTSTGADGDPGAGNIRFNLNASQATSTVLRMSTSGSSGAMLASLIDTFDDSTSSIRGHLRLCKLNDPTAFIVFAVTGISGAGAYRNVTGIVVNASSTNPFGASDAVLIYFQRTGDKGENGPILAPLLYVREERASGTSSATQLVANTFVKRSLNTVKTNTIPGASVVNDVITLPSGTYEYEGSAPAYQVGTHKAAVVNTTDNITDHGTSMSANVGTAITNQSLVRGFITIASPKTFELRQIANVAGSAGQPSGLGSTEVYAEIRFRKVA